MHLGGTSWIRSNSVVSLFRIAQHSWALSKLSTQDSGEIPPLHVYEIDPVTTASNADGDSTNGKTNPSNDNSTEQNAEQSKSLSPVKYSYLAIAQRKLDFVHGPLLHPFQLAVFGSPLLLRVRDLEGFTGNDLYALISKRIRRFVPNAPIVHDGGSTSSRNGDLGQDNVLSSTDDKGVPTTRQMRRGRQHRQKTTADMESVSAGEIPPFGFRLRLVSRDGSRCALCPWYACCVGCMIPCDDFPTIAMCGDSIAIDWHLSVDLQCGGFGWKINSAESVGIQASVHQRALVKVKKHSSFNNGGKRYGYSGSITLEECLDSFAKEEKIPEVRGNDCFVPSVDRTYELTKPYSTINSGVLFQVPRIPYPNKENESLEISTICHYSLKAIPIHSTHASEVERLGSIPHRGS